MNELLAEVQDDFPHFDRDFQSALRNIEFKAFERRSWPWVEDEMTRLSNELTRLQELHQPEPPPLASPEISL